MAINTIHKQTNSRSLLSSKLSTEFCVKLKLSLKFTGIAELKKNKEVTRKCFQSFIKLIQKISI